MGVLDTPMQNAENLKNFFLFILCLLTVNVEKHKEVYLRTLLSLLLS